MNPLTESEKRRKKALNIVTCAATFSAVLFVGLFLVPVQIEANGAWVNDCNEKYGEGNWETRDATDEERYNISHHIGSVPIPYIGQISVCVAKET